MNPLPVLLALAAVTAPAQEARAPEPSRLALLVGVGRAAPDAGLPALEGCAADLARVRQLLETRFGFGADDVLSLLDEEATHAAFLAAFDRHLLRRAVRGTEVLIYFSGHGSRVPDASGFESDGWDSSFLLYDSRSAGRRGEWDLTDDELHALVGALGRITDRVTVVTDACHSGGGLRGAVAGGVRAVPPGERGPERGADGALSELLPGGVRLDEDGAARELPPGALHVAACGRDQVARELTVDDGAERRTHGALTWFLALSLESCPPDASWREVCDEASVRLSAELPGQTVWYEGALERGVFGGAFEPRPAGFLGRVEPDGAVSVRAGWLHGLRHGSLLEASTAVGARALGQVRVDSLASASARGRWSEDAAGAPAGSALHLVEVRRPAGHPRMRLRLVGEAIPAEIAAWLAADPRVELRHGRDGDAARYALDLDEGGRLRLRTREGLPVWREAPSSGGARVERARVALDVALREEMRFRALWALAAERGDLPLNARFGEPSEELRDTLPVDFRTLPSAQVEPLVAREGHAGGARRATGSHHERAPRLTALHVENPHAQPVHVAVLSVAEDRGRHLIWPVAGSRDNRLAPGAELDIPVGVIARRTWPLERPMRDRYLVVATRAWADFSPFEHAATMRSGPSSEIPELLALALDAERTRGGRAVPVSTATWGITAVDLLVEPPPR